MPKPRRWKNAVFSIRSGFTFLGVYGRSESAAHPASIFRTERNPITVSSAIMPTRTIQQNHGSESFHDGISRYVPIEPFGFIMKYATPKPNAIPNAEPTSPIIRAYDV